GVSQLAEVLKPKAHRVLLIEDDRLEVYNSETYEKVLTQVITERKPFLTLIAHTAMGMDIAPSLAAHLKMPLATDCIGIDPAGETFSLTRQLYGGKVNATVSFLKKGPYMVTARAGAFPVVEKDALLGEMVKLPSPLTDEGLAKRFLQYVEAAVGEVDITQADILVSVGRGIKEADNIPMVKEFADAVGGTLSCSRPVVDKKWLPKDRQVGTSGKTVKPKVYIAIGISGAFQHVAGMKGAGTVIAINKDPKAPIFSVATYGIVADLFKIVPVLKDKMKELRKS
ncbi:MAG: electron transfer flavoprotein subunit alpha/FixB family protein, partial [Thermodesulfobacteriota bacterium]